MTTETIRTCDACGKVLNREFVHADVHHDNRTLIYYTDPKSLDFCMDCWYAAMKGARRKQDSLEDLKQMWNTDEGMA